MRKCYMVFCVFVLCAVCLFMLGDKSAAVNYDSKIEKAQKEQKQYAKKAEQLREDMKEIEESKEDTLSYIEKLDKKVSKVEDELEDVESGIKTTENKLKTAQTDLTRAQAEEEKQYTTMKRRIKYMYENGGEEYLEILLGASSLQDFLNRTEYVEKISSYDKNIFERYRQTKRKIEERKKEIEDTLTRLEGLKEEARAEKEALSKMRENKKKEIKKYNDKIKTSKAQADEYARQAAQAEEEVEKLLKAKQEEIDRQSSADMEKTGGGNGTLRWPLKITGRISSGFGRRHSPTAGASSYHKGIDIAVPSGTPIVAAESGTVVTAAYSSSAGNYVMISHGNRLYSVYMHCSKLAVTEGDSVKRGQVIAYAGSTGISTGSHLHFGVSKNGTYVNPLSYVSR